MITADKLKDDSRIPFSSCDSHQRLAWGTDMSLTRNYFQESHISNGWVEGFIHKFTGLRIENLQYFTVPNLWSGKRGWKKMPGKVWKKGWKNMNQESKETKGERKKNNLMHQKKSWGKILVVERKEGWVNSYNLASCLIFRWFLMLLSQYWSDLFIFRWIWSF